MKKELDFDVIVIGAGVAGLIAALKCEKAGYRTLVLESDSSIGGRVQSDIVNGFILDHGFQVIIDSYEKASEYLDFEELNLRPFASGARIFDDKGNYNVVDPRRQPSKALSTALSRIGKLSDKLKILGLARELQSKSLKDLFDGGPETTEDFLHRRGFSVQMIENFFRPFFGGIFLERELRTDAAMFSFVFRNFANGSACIPARGMGAIPKQLENKLQSTQIQTNTRVERVDQTPSVALSNGEVLVCRKLILACPPGNVLPQMDQNLNWNRTTTMFFEAPDTAMKMNKLIGLDARKKSSINNFARHDEVNPDSAPDGKSLWSVTLRNGADRENVERDLSNLIKSKDLSLIKTFEIDQALPVVERPKLTVPPEQTQLTEHIHIAGDYLTNASLDGAMRAGEAAALAVSETLEVRDKPGKAVK